MARSLGVRARAAVAGLAGRLDRRVHPYWRHVIRLDHPPTSDNRPRYGYGRPPHARLLGYLAEHDGTFRAEVDALAAYAEDLGQIPAHPTDPGEPCWLNPWLLGIDTVSLYGYVRRRRPARYVEIGSGQSTLVVNRAIRDGGLSTRITSIDPNPRAEVDAVCDEVIRRPFESVEPDRLLGLEPGDVLFVDASHRVFTNSDMVAFYLDVLPAIPEGVLVGIHDILWPDDYLPEWSEYWFSEQYLLAAWVLGGGRGIAPRLAANYVSQRPELGGGFDPVWDRVGLPELDRRGFSFWFEVER